MSQVRHMGSLPAPEDVVSLLEAALCKLFSNSIEWLNTDVDPYKVLVETLQDERAILNRHDRLQAKALFRQEETHGLSEELANFPLRPMSLKDDNVKFPADFLEPIYQVADHHEVKKAVREARLNVAAAVLQSNGPPANGPSKPSTTVLSQKF
ncbi:hypothetical protein BU25DRAFT_462139 [Macroventuria anomochaeta]|uniref:Uncharacterized protein n=1 Tax=Macroventuria anomochaeta TaxID=301207 RepID=A0ACB6RNC5_9PLEO|nr:uncharacterized protein BU25DRAFT_462139 [Macroventuria anomochaeta]KAF2623233.1 hypothetical protein BU25DRAFT_462139 [Macroventuria anomochaeta]